MTETEQLKIEAFDLMTLQAELQARFNQLEQRKQEVLKRINEQAQVEQFHITNPPKGN